MIRAALLGLMLAACSERHPPATLRDALARPVAEWKLTPDEWTHIVVEPYAQHYADYARAFDAAARGLDTQLATWRAHDGRLAQRAHYAGDPELTRGQARARWALPVQAPAEVAMLDGAPLDAVFVRAGDRYKAIVGVDEIVVAATRALDADCARVLEALGSKACQIVSWEIADAALRADRPRLAHACSLAATQCVR